MNPALSNLLRQAILVVAGIYFAKTSMSPDDINSIASAAVALIGFGWSAYEDRHEGIGFKRKKFAPGDEVVDGGQTWVCKE